jgi:hypothetical protein
VSRELFRVALPLFPAPSTADSSELLHVAPAFSAKSDPSVFREQPIRARKDGTLARVVRISHHV